MSNTVVVYLISNLGELVGEVFSDFPNESAFEPSVVKIYQESIDFREGIDYQPDHLNKNCFLNLSFLYGFAGVMVSVFASESSSTSSIPGSGIFFLLVKCFMFDMFHIFTHVILIIFIYAKSS